MTQRSVLLVKSGGEASLPEWQAHFAALRPELDVCWWNDPSVDPAAVAYVLVWEPPPGFLAGLPNLRVIFSSAAGVDHITRDPALPALPIVRMCAPEMAQTVGEYVCLACLAILRDWPRALAAQAAGRWDEFEAPRPATATRVGVMGLGTIGRRTAAMLQGLGFPVHGWSRGPKRVEGVRSFAGAAELPAFLAEADILVGVLPDTPQTRGLLRAETLALLPRGAGVVNAGRGSLLAMDDLLAALDSGQVGRAVLDVFEPEPLPPGHPAWRHPRLTVTAHIAGYAPRGARAAHVARAIALYERGEALPDLYRPHLGY